MAGYQGGAKIKELASEFGISRDTVCRHLNRQEIERRVQGLRPEDALHAAELHRTGWSLARIGEKFGTTAKTVRTRLLEVEVQMREPWDGHKAAAGEGPPCPGLDSPHVLRRWSP